MGETGAETLKQHLLRIKKGEIQVDPQVKTSFDLIKDISIIPPRDYSVSKRLRDEKTGKPGKSIKIRVTAPARIKLVLSRVDQDLFNRLSDILGEDYFRTFPARSYVRLEDKGDTLNEKKRAFLAREILPATEHNPVIIFHLRQGVRFHDGHELDAHDVKLTYEAIMNPKNLSLRISDYEPIKQVDVIDPLSRGSICVDAGGYDACDPVVPVEAASWGSIKAQYK